MENPQSISLATYNIHKGFGVGRLRFVLPQIHRALETITTDFIFLQEVQGSHHRLAKKISNWPSTSQLEYIAGSSWPHHIYAKNAVYRAGHHGNAILSKYPFELCENINLSSMPRASRSILHAQVNLENGQRLHLLCVHLGLFKAERRSQCKILIKRIEEMVPENEPLIMAGDFNDWRQHLSHQLAYELGILETFQELKGKHARTFPALKPTLSVDRIYFRGLKPISADCLSGKPWRTLSDHLPLYASFEKEKAELFK